MSNKYTTDYCGFALIYKENLELKSLITLRNSFYKYHMDFDNDEPLIFDVGAHIGTFALLCKSKKIDSTIVCFEPNPETFKLLAENIKNNELRKITCYEVALTRSDGYRNLYGNIEGGTLANTLSKEWVPDLKGMVCKTFRASYYIDKPIDLLKINNEHSERDIIIDLDENRKLKYIKKAIIEIHSFEKQPEQLLFIKEILEHNNFIVYIQQFERILLDKITPNQRHLAKNHYITYCIVAINKTFQKKYLYY